MAVIRGGFLDAPDIVACYEEAPGGGDIRYISSPCNAPAANPMAHLDKVVWHPSLFLWEVVFVGDVPVTHSAYAGKTTTYGVSSGGTFYQYNGIPASAVGVQVYGQSTIVDRLLYTHGAGSDVFAMVAYQGRMLPSGYMVQQESSGAIRLVSPWYNAGGVYLRETLISSNTDLPAADRTYSVLVMRNRAPDPSKPNLSGGPGLPLQMCRGMIDSSRRYAKKVAAGDSPFDLNLGPTLDIGNGRQRSATGGIIVDEAGYVGGMGAPAFVSIGV